MQVINPEFSSEQFSICILEVSPEHDGKKYIRIITISFLNIIKKNLVKYMLEQDDRMPYFPALSK